MSERRERSAKRPGRSVYDDREREVVGRERRITMDIRTGQILNQSRCCDEPLRCERPECWARLGELRR
jgi:hypothetical protein